MSAEEHPAKAEMEEFAKALAKASDEQLQSCAATLQKKAGDHVYLDTVGVAAAFATMTRMVDGTGHSANLTATKMAKHVTNSVVQVRRSLRRRWLLVLLGGVLAGVAAKKCLSLGLLHEVPHRPLLIPGLCQVALAMTVHMASYPVLAIGGALGFLIHVGRTEGPASPSALGTVAWALLFQACLPSTPAQPRGAGDAGDCVQERVEGLLRPSLAVLLLALALRSLLRAHGPGLGRSGVAGVCATVMAGLRIAGAIATCLWILLKQLEVGAAASHLDAVAGALRSGASMLLLGLVQAKAKTEEVHLLSGSAYEVRGCHDLRDFKQALSKELGHPAYLLTLLSDGVAITCNDEWQRLDSSKHLVAVQSCPFTDFVTDFDQDLIEASTAGDISRAEELLAKGQRPDADVVRGRHNAGVKPLHLAAEAGNADLVRLLIQARAAINGGRCDKTPLQLACQAGQPTVLAVLVEAGADINAASRCGRTPLQLACAGGHYHCVYNLVLAAADVNHTANSGRTPLQLACEFGHIDVIKLLIRAGADIHKKGIHGGTPLQITCEKGYLEAARLLIRAGADINTASRYSRTALQLACENGHIEVVTYLIEQRADVISQRNYGRTPLQLAAEQGHPAVVKELVEARADTQVAGAYGRTPWTLACEGNFQVVQAAATDASEEFGAGFVSGWLSATVGSLAALLGLGQDRRLGLTLLAWFLHLHRSAADLATRIAKKSRPEEGSALPAEASVRLLFLIDNFRSLVAMAVWSFLGRPLERLVTWMLPGRLRVFAFEAPIDDLGGLLQAGVCLMLEGSSWHLGLGG
eukprot:s5500_g1.t2